jgi:hypothetical protein
MSSLLFSANSDKPALNLNVNAVFPKKSVIAIADIATATLPAASWLVGILTYNGSQAQTLNTDTAANLIAALPNPSVGSSFMCHIYNRSAFTVTVAGGSGVSTGGSSALAIPTLTTKSIQFLVTSPTTVSLYI